MTGHLVYAAAQEHSADLRRQAQEASRHAVAGSRPARRRLRISFRTRRAPVARAAAAGR